MKFESAPKRETGPLSAWRDMETDFIRRAEQRSTQPKLAAALRGACEDTTRRLERLDAS